MKRGWNWCLVLLLTLSLWCLGEGTSNAPGLTDVAKGQVLLVCRPDGKRFLVLFQKTVREGGEELWNCKLLNSGDERTVPPSQCTLLPFTETVNSSEVTTYIVYSLFQEAGKGSLWERLCASLLIWKDGERARSIRKYVNAETSLMAKIDKRTERARQKRGAWRSKALDEAADLLETEDEAMSALNDLLDRGDLFAAIGLYLHFRTRVQASFAGVVSKTSVNELFSKWDKQIASAVCDSWQKDSARVQSYRSLFPDSSGLWNQAAPMTLGELQSYFVLSYRGFLAARYHSSFCDFKAWGAGMLSVLSLVGGDCEAEQQFGKEFDEAMQLYKEHRDEW